MQVRRLMDASLARKSDRRQTRSRPTGENESKYHRESELPFRLAFS